MTIKLKPDNGLALNQNIVLMQIYHDQIAEKTRPSWCDRNDIFYNLYDRNWHDTYAGLTKKQCRRAVGRLISRGYLIDSPDHRWQLSSKGIKAVEDNDYIRSGPMGPHTGIRKPPKGTLASYVWAALRTRNSATIEELLRLILIEDDDFEKKLKSTRRLLYWLCKANIVRKLPRKQEGHHYNSRGHTRYQLMIDLGPKHPIIRQRKHQIYDPNAQSNIPFKEVLKGL